MKKIVNKRNIPCKYIGYFQARTNTYASVDILKKNEKIKLDIIDMTKDGLGLAKLDGQVFFVKVGLVGDIVEVIVTKVANNVVYAKAISIIEKSKYRVTSKCDIANACGGCQLLNLKYEEQLKLKIGYLFLLHQNMLLYLQSNKKELYEVQKTSTYSRV